MPKYGTKTTSTSKPKTTGSKTKNKSNASTKGKKLNASAPKLLSGIVTHRLV